MEVTDRILSAHINLFARNIEQYLNWNCRNAAGHKKHHEEKIGCGHH